MNFEEVYNNYLEYAKSRHKKQGFETLLRDFKLHILPYFKDKNICDLKKIDIVNWQTIILNKKFSNNFNRNLYYEFSAFITYCVYCSYLDSNVVLDVEKFKKRFEEDKHDFYTLREFKRFIGSVDDVVYRRFFEFMFYYGTRPGETMALRFSDLEGDYIHIRHNILRKGNRDLDTPKNQSSIRCLKLSFITQYRLYLLKKYYVKKYGIVSDYFIFGGIKPLAPTTVDRVKKKACEKAKIRCITQHQFRHSCATYRINKGVPIKTVSKDLGHSTVSMTVDVYLHEEKREHRSLKSRFNF